MRNRFFFKLLNRFGRSLYYYYFFVLFSSFFAVGYDYYLCCNGPRNLRSIHFVVSYKYITICHKTQIKIIGRIQNYVNSDLLHFLHLYFHACMHAYPSLFLFPLQFFAVLCTGWFSFWKENVVSSILLMSVLRIYITKNNKIELQYSNVLFLFFFCYVLISLT